MAVRELTPSHIGVTQYADLDERQDDDEDADEEREKQRTERQIMKLAELH